MMKFVQTVPCTVSRSEARVAKKYKYAPNRMMISGTTFLSTAGITYGETAVANEFTKYAMMSKALPAY